MTVNKKLFVKVVKVMRRKSYNKNNILLIVSMILALMLISNVYALGIAPSKKIISYEQYMSEGYNEYNEYNIDSKIINDNGKDIAVKVTASGGLSEYVSIVNPLIYLSKDEPETGFSYTITLPQGLAPGTHSISIVISEYDIGSDTQAGNSVGGLLTITQQLIIEVPYSGKYLEGYLSAYTISEDDDQLISAFNIISKGTEDINDVRVVLRVADSYNNTVQIKELGAYNIGSSQSIKIEEQTVMERPGAYILEYRAYYDDKELMLDKGLSVGEYELSVLSTGVENFKLGTIAKFNINVDSSWNAPISGIEGVVTIRDMKGNIIDTINTENVTINPKNGAITAYWDTTNIRSGQYIINIVLRAGNQLVTQEYITEVSANQIIVNNPEVMVNNRNQIYKIITVISMVAIAIITLSIIILKRKKS